MQSPASPPPVASQTFFDDIKEYVDFDDDDARVLADLLPILEPHFTKISEHFYERILAHPRAHDAITGGHAQVERLKHTLSAWMRSGLVGPHDETFYERRARIGRVHVQIALPQQYMVTAMNVMRVDYRAVLRDHFEDTGRFAEVCDAVDRLFDLELAIMLQTYRIDSEERLRRRERLATIGQLAASIGHDLRNPLGVIESSLFILRRRIRDNEAALRHIEKISKQVGRCDRIVTDLLDMARNSPPKWQPIDFDVLVGEALEASRVPSQIQIECVVDDALHFEADPGLLQQALVNLVTNSVRALADASSQGHIRISAAPIMDRVSIRIEDNGPGFDANVLPLAFEPLVSTRAKGIGLGLALVKSVAERHGGEANAGNRNEGGAVVELLLPKTPPLVQNKEEA